MSHHNSPPYYDEAGNRLEPQAFRAILPIHGSAPTTMPALVEELSSFEDGNTNFPDVNPWLPRMTQVDSVRVLTSADGLEGNLAESVARMLSLGTTKAVLLIEGLAVPALKSASAEAAG